MQFDAAIVGGGPAGLSAALVLGRCLRSVLVVDSGNPRNAASRCLHNFLTRDGINPKQLLSLGRAEVARYGVQVRSGVVSRATCTPSGFVLRLRGAGTVRARTLLLATGVVDELPVIGNVRDFYGVGVHHCPYCDALHYRDKALAAYGKGPAALGLGLALLNWSRRVTLVTDGEAVSPTVRKTATRHGMEIRTEPVLTLRSKRGRVRGSTRDPLGAIRFRQGADLNVAGMFFNTDKWQRSQLPVQLGCRIDREGGVVRDRKQRTGVKGLYLAGDASFDVQFAIVAAAEGAKAGVAMNRDLQEWDLRAEFKRGRRAGTRRG